MIRQNNCKMVEKSTNGFYNRNRDVHRGKSDVQYHRNGRKYKRIP